MVGKQDYLVTTWQKDDVTQRTGSLPGRHSSCVGEIDICLPSHKSASIKMCTSCWGHGVGSAQPSADLSAPRVEERRFRLTAEALQQSEIYLRSYRIRYQQECRATIRFQIIKSRLSRPQSKLKGQEDEAT
jgi:hypothetical protein